MEPPHLTSPIQQQYSVRCSYPCVLSISSPYRKSSTLDQNAGAQTSNLLAAPKVRLICDPVDCGVTSKISKGSNFLSNVAVPSSRKGMRWTTMEVFEKSGNRVDWPGTRNVESAPKNMRICVFTDLITGLSDSWRICALEFQFGFRIPLLHEPAQWKI